MSKDGSVAPKERINIKYVPATGDQQAEMELPLKMFVVGDFKGQAEETPLEDRKSISVDKNNFKSVMKEAGLSLSTTVSNRLEDNADDLPVNLEFKGLEDFAPDSVARQVPELRKLIELREALVALKGPLGNVPSFRSKLQEMLDNDDAREKLLAELDLVSSGDEPSKD
ncbi:type VI secretion system contractile sheath small subunit [Marinobacter sp. BGYM27]|uniref:type VI secretion system contractile sheath small subunit n=1 Tax=unclassified Marinobacter TaxID=83889 RepID=UPI0021A5A61B|nr:type VI secretion system contractile sheath small subunit [Marinobacter sp. BGYM27]MDG5501113.1 type VI secretion system contractile sheath small subunit [Marinobacter sp. BGYM27]|tara:strand:+ start:11392 stop:11898 length:507 start_codon:yes stop_codon:yes gene_type:complete